MHKLSYCWQQLVYNWCCYVQCTSRIEELNIEILQRLRLSIIINRDCDDDFCLSDSKIQLSNNLLNIR